MLKKENKYGGGRKDSEEEPCPQAHREPRASLAHIGPMCGEAFCARQQAQWVLLQTLGTEPGLAGPDSYTIWRSILIKGEGD